MATARHVIMMTIEGPAQGIDDIDFAVEHFLHERGYAVVDDDGYDEEDD